MKVFLINLSDIFQNPDLIQRYESLLSPTDKLRYYHIKLLLRRLQFLAGRALVFEQCHEMPTLADTGKPIISKGYISISHSENWVVVAYSDTPLGVDIENTKVDRPFSKLSQRLGFLKSDRMGFYRSFTQFESDYKLGPVKQKIHHNFYLIDTFIVSISHLNNKENIEFIKTIPFIQKTPFIPQDLP